MIREFPRWASGTSLRCLAFLAELDNGAYGYDIARAAGRKWRIEPAPAAMVVRQFFVPVLQTVNPRTFVNAEQAACLRSTYELHLRGGGQLNFVFDDGSLRISAYPAASFMVFWDRQSQWNAIAKGSAHGLGPQALAGVDVQVPDTQPLARPCVNRARPKDPST